MSASQNQREDTPTPPNKPTVVLLLGTIADTTWRMFVPIIGLTIVGVMSDLSFGTKPCLTVIGIVLGVAIAALLVRRQIKKARN